MTTEGEWDELEGAWDALLERSSSRTIFLTWEWLRSWWASYAEYVGAEGLHLLVANDEDGVAGIAPLYWGGASGYGLGKLRVLRLIGDGSEDSEYLDFIVAAGREAEVIDAFFDHLDHEGWDVVELNLLPGTSPNLRPVSENAGRRGYRVTSESFACTALELPDAWEDYLGGLQSRFRTKVRSLLRRLPEEHGAAFDACEDSGELPGELENMFRMHQDRWRAVGEPGSFAVPERRAFYRRITESFLGRGWLRFFRLRLDGRPAAYEFSFAYDGRVYYLQQAYDMEFSDLSVGNALKAFVLRECIERGVCEYDFLGDAADHKLKWGAEVRGCSRLRVMRPGSRIRWGLWVPDLLGRVRERCRAASPEVIVRLKRRVQRRLAGLG